MPELPEVETIRRQLEPLVVGRRLGDAWAFPHPKFTPALEVGPATVERVGRRGKYLLIGLDVDRELVVHLGMTGSLRVRPPGDVGDDYVRAWWALDDGGEALEYRDVRRFGRLAVAEGGRYAGTLAVQGPDALDGSLTAEAFWRSLRASRRAVKTQLLSQRPIAGVGNIYADEALWRARINPARRTVDAGPGGGPARRAARRAGGQPPLRRHDADRLPRRRRARGPQPAAPGRVRPGGVAVPALRHRAAVAHARRPHRDVVPDLPAPLTPHRSGQLGRRWTWRAPAWSRASTTS